MKILHILKSTPDATTKTIIDAMAAGNLAAMIDLQRPGVAYDAVVAEIFSNDRVFCW